MDNNINKKRKYSSQIPSPNNNTNDNNNDNINSNNLMHDDEDENLIANNSEIIMPSNDHDNNNDSNGNNLMEDDDDDDDEEDEIKLRRVDCTLINIPHSNNNSLDTDRYDYDSNDNNPSYSNGETNQDEFQSELSDSEDNNEITDVNDEQRCESGEMNELSHINTNLSDYPITEKERGDIINSYNNNDSSSDNAYSVNQQSVLQYHNISDDDESNQTDESHDTNSSEQSETESELSDSSASDLQCASDSYEYQDFNDLYVRVSKQLNKYLVQDISNIIIEYIAEDEFDEALSELHSKLEQLHDVIENYIKTVRKGRLDVELPQPNNNIHNIMTPDIVKLLSKMWMEPPFMHRCQAVPPIYEYLSDNSAKALVQFSHKYLPIIMQSNDYYSFDIWNIMPVCDEWENEPNIGTNQQDISTRNLHYLINIISDEIDEWEDLFEVLEGKMDLYTEETKFKWRLIEFCKTFLNESKSSRISFQNGIFASKDRETYYFDNTIVVKQTMSSPKVNAAQQLCLALNKLSTAYVESDVEDVRNQLSNYYVNHMFRTSDRDAVLNEYNIINSIRMEQRAYDLCIDTNAFKNLVDECFAECKCYVRPASDVYECLQEACEAYLVEQFQRAGKIGTDHNKDYINSLK